MTNTERHIATATELILGVLQNIWDRDLAPVNSTELKLQCGRPYYFTEALKQLYADGAIRLDASSQIRLVHPVPVAGKEALEQGRETHRQLESLVEYSCPDCRTVWNASDSDECPVGCRQIEPESLEEIRIGFLKSAAIHRRQWESIPRLDWSNDESRGRALQRAVAACSSAKFIAERLGAGDSPGEVVDGVLARLMKLDARIPITAITFQQWTSALVTFRALCGDFPAAKSWRATRDSPGLSRIE